MTRRSPTPSAPPPAIPLSEVASDLYGLPPGEFVAGRAAHVKEAKEAGDKELAAAIGALRKPTVTAWAINLLARAAPTEVDALLRLGTALRTAQRELSGDRLRTLTAQRQQVVTALAKQAGALAAAQDRPISESALREIGQTLTAALADPEVAEQVRTGTLTTAASYEGFGPAGPNLVAVDGGATAEPAAGDTEDTAEQELEDARGALEAARTARDSAQAALDQAANQLADTESQLTALREQLAHAEQQKQFARTAERGAQEQLRSAQKQFDRMERWVQRAQQRTAD